jgi:hypothetical protein
MEGPFPDPNKIINTEEPSEKQNVAGIAITNVRSVIFSEVTVFTDLPFIHTNAFAAHLPRKTSIDRK